MSQVSLRRLNSKAASNRGVGGSRAVAAKSAIATKSAGIARNKAAVAKSKVAANNVAAASKADAKLNLIIAMKERREATPAVYLLIPPSNKRERMVNLIFIPHLGPLLFVRGKSSVDWIVGTARIP